MNRSLLGFLVFLGLLVAAVGVGVWLVGPSLLELAFDADRREQPYFVLHFSQADATPQGSGYRRAVVEQMTVDGGRLTLRAGVEQVIEGRLRDAWETVDVVAFDRAGGLVRMATSAAFRGLMGRRTPGSTMLLGTSVAPEPVIGGEGVLLIALLAFDEERLRNQPVADLSGFAPSLARFSGQVVWQAPLDQIAEPEPWNYLVMLAFASRDQAQLWLDDPDAATDRALGRRYLRDAALLWLRDASVRRSRAAT